MVSLTIIIIFLIVLFVFFKFTGFRNQPIVTYSIGFVLLLLAVTFVFVVNEQGLDLTSFDGLISAVRIYFVWVGNVFNNIGTITGSASNLEWSSRNISNLAK